MAAGPAVLVVFGPCGLQGALEHERRRGHAPKMTSIGKRAEEETPGVKSMYSDEVSFHRRGRAVMTILMIGSSCLSYGCDTPAYVRYYGRCAMDVSLLCQDCRENRTAQRGLGKMAHFSMGEDDAAIPYIHCPFFNLGFLLTPRYTFYLFST